MALILKRGLPHGASASYWRVVETNINWVERCAHVSLAGYIDQKTRDAGKSPITSVSFDWQGDKFPFTNNLLNPRGIAYATIKKPILSEPNEKGEVVNTNPFVDAIDDTKIDAA